MTNPLIKSIDENFFLETFRELALIGRDPGGRGYQRLAWSKEERQAHQWFQDKCRTIGLNVYSDEAGNTFADLPHSRALAALTLGSHLDSVPYGGTFDGGYGVVAALTAAKAILDQGITLNRPLRIAAFTDEEGPRFGTGLLGSKALSGALDMDLITKAQDQYGITLREAMAEYQHDMDKLPMAAQRLDTFYGYIEIHIEQGPRLERQRIPIATVTTITGIRQVRLTYVGKANHAGTTPKEERQNALRAAAETITSFSRYVDSEEALVANPGHIVVHPNATNVVPGEVRLQWDLRSPNADVLEAAYRELSQVALKAGATSRVDVEVEIFHDVVPSPLHEPWMNIVEEAAHAQKLSSTRLVSWAGHDAGVLGMVMPAAMIFIPSQAGISHAPEEFSTDADMLQGVRVLAETAARLLTNQEEQ